MTPSPMLYLAAGLLAALLIAIGVEEFRLSESRADIAGLQADNAHLQAAAHELELANKDWAEKSAAQSAAVEQLAKLAQDNAAAGAARARAVLAKPVAVPQGHGPVVLNAWYAQP